MNRKSVVLAAAILAAVIFIPGGGRAEEPADPALVFLSEYDTGLGAGNAEIVDVEPGSGLAFVTADGDRSVIVFDVSDPEKPRCVRRDALPGGSATSVAVHPTAGYYLVAIQHGAPSGEDVVEVRSTAGGELLRRIAIGEEKGPDAIAIGPGGRHAVLANEAEAPWRPGSVMVFDLGPGPFDSPAAAAAAIGAPTEIGLDGLVPSTGAFSRRWVDRAFNGPLPKGVTAKTKAGPVTIGDGDHRAKDPDGALADDAIVTFTYRDLSLESRYRFDGEAGQGDDGNVFLFALDDRAISLEPEYVAFDAAGKVLVVTLQENNAVVVIDLSGPVPAIRGKQGVFGLGKVDVPDADVVRRDPDEHSRARFEDHLNVEREPDGVAIAKIGGVDYFVTADEGDTYGPDWSTKSDARQRGGRTVSVFRLSDGALVGDTGAALDHAVDECGRWAAFIESSRARRGGSEPENLAVTVADGRTLAVVALERANALALVDLTRPEHPAVLGVVGAGGLSGDTARMAPEGVKIVTLGGRTIVLAAFEASGVVGLFEIR